MGRGDDLSKKIIESLKQRAGELAEESKSNKENADSYNKNTDAINKNTEARKKNTEQTKKSVTQQSREEQAKKDEIEKLKQINESLRIRHQNSEDVLRQKKKELDITIKGRDAQKSEALFIKESAKARKEELALLKEDIILRSKEANIRLKEDKKKDIEQIRKLTNANKELEVVKKRASAQNEKEKKQLKSLRLQREKNKEVLRNLNVIAKQHGITLKDLTGNLDLVKKAVRGDVRAMGQLKRAMREATKQGTVLNEKLGILSVRSQRNVGGAFSVLRSKLLLASFGFSVTAGNVLKLISAYGQQERAEKSLATALESTNYSSGQTASSLIEYAGALQKATGVTDELIIESSALLATFTQISGEVFTRTQNSILDVTIAMNQGNVTTETLKTSTIQLGKALNDPVKGLSALSRVGIQFSKDQKELIKQFVEMGDITSAQNIILDEMDVQFGGMSEAFRQTAEGSLMALNSAFGDLQERMGGFLANAGVVDVFNGLANAINKINPSHVANISASITSLGLALSMGKIVGGAKALGMFFKVASSKGVATGMRFLTKASKGLALFVRGLSGLTVIGAGTILLDILGVFKKMDKPVENVAENIQKIREGALKIPVKNLEQELQIAKDQYANLLESIKQQSEVVDEAIYDRQHHFYKGRIELQNKLIKEEEDLLNLSRQERDELELHVKAIQDRINKQEELKLALSKSTGFEASDEVSLYNTVEKMLKQTTTAQELYTEELLAYVDALAQENGVSMAMLELRENLVLKLDDLRNGQQKYKEALDKSKKSVKEIKDEQEKAWDSSKLLEEGVRSVAGALADVIIEGKRLEQLDLGKILLKSVLSTAINMGINTLMGNIFSAPMHSGGQVSKYHSGGLTQNEVPAILEQGEFVVRKEAVDSVGLETLNRINQSGSTGSVNISFTGNVLSQDFIEDEAIPIIKEAVRRGADIGVS